VSTQAIPNSETSIQIKITIYCSTSDRNRSSG